MTSQLVEFEIQSLDAITTQTLTGYTVDNLACNVGVVDWSKEKQKFPHLAKVEFPKLPDGARLSLLIGTDRTDMFRQLEVVSDPKNPAAPLAVRTPLRCTCLGMSGNKRNGKLSGRFAEVLLHKSQN